MPDPSSSPAASGDESFIAFMFAVVSVVGLCMYLPWAWGLGRRLIVHYTSSNRRHYSGKDPVGELIDTVTYIPYCIFSVVRSPGVLVGGCEALIAQPRLALTLYLPRFLKFMIRPRILVLWLWVVLFSSVMYTTLTFDAYAILGVPPTASNAEVKKAYRALTKMYHPDQNSTETARVLYAKVKKAYKYIMRKDDPAFEEEQRLEEFSVGVGLPSFLMGGGNDTLVLFGMLGLMLAIPIGLFLKFRDSDNKILRLMEKIKNEKQHVSVFLEQLNVPKDATYEIKKLSRNEILRVLKLVGLAPADLHDTAALVGVPQFPEFILRCISPEKYMAAFRANGFDEEGVGVLCQWAVDNGEAAVDAYEKQVEEIKATAEMEKKSDFVVSEAKYRAVRFLLAIHCDAVVKDIEELQKCIPSEIRAARRIVALYKELFELLTFVYEREKPLLKHQQSLINMSRMLDEAMEELFPDVDKIFRKHYKQYYEQQIGKKALKRIQKMQAMSRGRNAPPMMQQQQ